MDGRGRWMDNVFIERLWRSVKYEEIYLHEHATLPALEGGLERWFTRYNTWRPHAALGNKTPKEVYQNPPAPAASAPPAAPAKAA
jgi:putative transposase